jgi:transposase
MKSPSEKVREIMSLLRVDLDKNKLIGLVESRKHKDIKEVLKSFGDEAKSQIKEVSIDLSGNYRSFMTLDRVK